MIRKNAVFSFVLLVLMITVLTACGSDNPTSKAATPLPPPVGDNTVAGTPMDLDSITAVPRDKTKAIIRTVEFDKDSNIAYTQLILPADFEKSEVSIGDQKVTATITKDGDIVATIDVPANLRAKSLTFSFVNAEKKTLKCVMTMQDTVTPGEDCTW